MTISTIAFCWLDVFATLFTDWQRHHRSPLSASATGLVSSPSARCCSSCCYLLLHDFRGRKPGIYFADSAKLALCHSGRINRHRVFLGLAQRGRSTMGWFLGFKLHLHIHHKGQPMAFNYRWQQE